MAREDYRVKVSRRKAWRIGDGALREVLEPAGLWERVVSERVDCRAKAELPKDDDLPEELRKALNRVSEDLLAVDAQK